MIRKVVVISLLALFLCSSALRAEEAPRDPYKILLNSYEALGGLEALKAESTMYVEASVYVMGMNGKMIQWTKKPCYSRGEIHIKEFYEIQSNNCEFLWSTSLVHPEPEIKDDQATLTRIRLDKYVADYEFMIPSSDIFSLSYEGISTFDNTDFYLVKVTNTINADYILTYIDTTTFLCGKTIEVEYDPYKKTITVGSDYRELHGILRAMCQEITELPVNQTITFRIIKCDVDIPVDDSLFYPPD